MNKYIGKPTGEIKINLNNLHFKNKSISRIFKNLEEQDKKNNINKSYAFYFL